MKCFVLNNRTGSSLVELVVSIGIFAVAGTTIALLIFSAYRSGDVGGERSQAAAVGREGWEAVKSIGTSAYNKLKIGTYGLDDSGGSWVFSGASDTDGKYTRTVQIEAVDRDGSGDIASGTNDIHTRKATTTVSWLFGAEARTLSFVDYFTNWDSRRFLEDTSTDFSDGAFTGTSISTDVDPDGAVGVSSIAFFACAYIEGSFDQAGSVNANDVAYSGNTAYLVTQSNGGGGEFLVIDYSTPSSPTLLGSVELTTNAIAVAVSGQFAYVATTSDTAELIVIDVSVPTAPTQLATLDLTGNIDPQDITASGSYAYLTRSNNTAAAPEFYVINIGTPSSPSVLGSADLGATTQAVTLSGNFAYVVTDGDTAEFRVVDVSAPALPGVVATIDLPTNSNGRELSVFGTNAYVVTDNTAGSEFYVINISTPTLPSITGSVDLGNGATSIAMDGTVAMIGTVTAGRTLQIVNADIPSAPVLSNSLDVAASGYNALVWNGTRLLAASADDAGEFQVLQRPTSQTWNCIERKGTYNTSDTVNALAVYASGTKAYFVTGNAPGAEFFILDVTTPTAPTLLGSLELGGNANDVVVSGAYAYVATASNTQELTVIDVSNAASPTIVGAYDAAGTVDGLAVAITGTKALLAQGTTFFEIDVSTPTAPALLGSMTLAGTPHKIRALNTSTAYVSTTGNTAEVQVINISGNTPSAAGSYDAPGGSDGSGLWIKGSQLFFTSFNSSGTEFYVLDITNPTVPTLVGGLEIGGTANAVAADDDELFAFIATANIAQAVRVVDVGIPSTPRQTAVVSLGAAANDLFFVGNYLYAVSSADAAEFTIYGKLAGAGGYQTSGTYSSSVFDATGTANWDAIEWSEDVTGCLSGDIRLQVRTAMTSGGLSSELWQGPDGEDADETDFFTDPLGELIDTTHNGDPFAQYRVTFTTDGICTLYLTDLTLTYTPL